MEFTIGSAIRVGWETFKLRPWFFTSASAIIVLAHILATAISTVIDVGGTFDEPTAVGHVADFALGTLVDMGMLWFFLVAHASPETVEWSQLWHPRPYWKYLATSFFVYLAILLGLVLLIVPGIIALVCFMFATIFVMDRGLGPVDAMSESVRITRGHRWQLLGLFAVQMLVVAAGALALGVGLLVALPVVMLSFVHAYRVLLSKASSQEATDVAVTPRE